LESNQRITCREWREIHPIASAYYRNMMRTVDDKLGDFGLHASKCWRYPASHLIVLDVIDAPEESADINAPEADGRTIREEVDPSFRVRRIEDY
jgi:hypothetical protein